MGQAKPNGVLPMPVFPPAGYAVTLFIASDGLTLPPAMAVSVANRNAIRTIWKTENLLFIAPHLL